MGVSLSSMGPELGIVLDTVLSSKGENMAF